MSRPTSQVRKSTWTAELSPYKPAPLLGRSLCRRRRWNGRPRRQRRALGTASVDTCPTTVKFAHCRYRRRTRRCCRALDCRHRGIAPNGASWIWIQVLCTVCPTEASWLSAPPRGHPSYGPDDSWWHYSPAPQLYGFTRLLRQPKSLSTWPWPVARAAQLFDSLVTNAPPRYPRSWGGKGPCESGGPLLPIRGGTRQLNSRKRRGAPGCTVGD